MVTTLGIYRDLGSKSRIGDFQDRGRGLSTQRVGMDLNPKKTSSVNRKCSVYIGVLWRNRNNRLYTSPFSWSHIDDRHGETDD